MSEQVERIKTALSQMIGPDARVEVLEISQSFAPLFPAEETAVARAVPKRRTEFQAGRQAARAALAALGVAPAVIPMGEDRAPVWPDGFTGSISHSDSYAAAIAAPCPPASALGLDMETDTTLEPDLWDIVLTMQELEWLQTMPASERGQLAKRLFTIKECAYKAQYGVSRSMLDFQAFNVCFSEHGSRFSAEFQLDVPPFRKGDKVAGNVANIGGMIVATARL